MLCAAVIQSSDAFEITETVEMVRLVFAYCFETGSALFTAKIQNKLFFVTVLTSFIEHLVIFFRSFFLRTGLTWSIFKDLVG